MYFFRQRTAFNVTFCHLPAFIHSAVGKKTFETYLTSSEKEHDIPD